jgi:cobalt/nickel transport system permease protein
VHIPDGFLSAPVWATLDAVSIPAVAWFARRAKTQVDERATPLLGVLGAFVFAAQTVNFPVAPGTSAHLLGGTLLACTVGPAAAAVVMTAVLLIQALVFQDGGVLAFGANVVNLAIIGVLAGYVPYRALAGTRWRDVGLFAGGFLSVVTSGALAVLELQLSNVRIDGAAAGFSFGLFALNGVAEGLITVAVVRALGVMNASWVPQTQPGKSATGHALAAAAIAIAVAGFAVASTSPDTLEALAERAGFASNEIALLRSPFADYQVPSIPLEGPAKAAAALLGVALVYAACSVVAKYPRRNT